MTTPNPPFGTQAYFLWCQNPHRKKIVSVKIFLHSSQVRSVQIVQCNVIKLLFWNHFCSWFLQNAPSAQLQIWFFWWMAHGALAETTLSTSVVLSLAWLGPLTLARTKLEWLWYNTVRTLAQSSLSHVTPGEETCSKPSTRFHTREAIP